MAAEIERLLRVLKERSDKRSRELVKLTDWKNVVVAPEPREALPPIDSLEESSLDTSAALQLSDINETDTQTSTTNVSLFDALREDIPLVAHGEGNGDALVNPYSPRLPLPTPTLSLQDSLASEGTAITAPYHDAAPTPQYSNASQYIQPSMNIVKAPFVEAGHPAANKHTIPFAEWYQRVFYRPPPCAETASFIPPPPGGTYLTPEQSLFVSLGFEYTATGGLQEPQWSNFGIQPQTYGDDMGSFDLRKDQTHGSIGPMRTSGQERGNHIRPYERPQGNEVSESRNENEQYAGPLLLLSEIHAPNGKTKTYLTTEKLTQKYPRIDPSAFYVFTGYPPLFDCPVPHCTHPPVVMSKIKDHGKTHASDGRVTVTNEKKGTKSIKLNSFYKNVKDRQTMHTCAYCERPLKRNDQFHSGRHLEICPVLAQKVEQVVLDSRDD
ncbi:hypothetical protein CPB85DRAFT_1443389 [Mucidula mucida]|nr:hypothetical protein CPB85DRAFT_1443389 [Mucidula mucida]